MPIHLMVRLQLGDRRVTVKSESMAYIMRACEDSIVHKAREYSGKDVPWPKKCCGRSAEIVEKAEESWKACLDPTSCTLGSDALVGALRSWQSSSGMPTSTGPKYRGTLPSVADPRMAKELSLIHI